MQGLANGGRLPQDDAEGQKDGQSVVAVHVDHLQDTLVALLRAFLDESEVASLKLNTNMYYSHFRIL